MAKALPWTPWHEVVRLREELRSDALPLASFAADLFDVAMGRAREIYQDPKQFFALTYPTFNLRELAKDVVQRLAGRNDKAVRQLELTYGGGKTHTLITLLHLVEESITVPKAAREVIEAAVGEAVAKGMLWLAFGPASLLAEPIPTGLLNEEASLAGPPPPISVADVLPEILSGAWSNGETTALALITALSQRAGYVVPWARVRTAIDGAMSSRFIGLAEGSAPWPSEVGAAAAVRFRLIEGERLRTPPPLPSGLIAEAQLEPEQIQDFAIGCPTFCAQQPDWRFESVCGSSLEPSRNTASWRKSVACSARSRRNSTSAEVEPVPTGVARDLAPAFSYDQEPGMATATSPRIEGGSRLL